MAIVTNLTYKEALELQGEKHISLLGSTVIVYTGEDIPKTTVPEIVSMSSARVVLSHMGYLTSVQAAVESLGSDAIIMWEYSPYLGRRNPVVLKVLTGLGLSSDEIDTLFISAEAI